METESSAINPYNGSSGSKVGFARSVEEYIHRLPKCVCIANPIIQLQFLILATFLIRPSVKKN
jgi:hypothetical protein